MSSPWQGSQCLQRQVATTLLPGPIIPCPPLWNFQRASPQDLCTAAASPPSFYLSAGTNVNSWSSWPAHHSSRCPRALSHAVLLSSQGRLRFSQGSILAGSDHRRDALQGSAQHPEQSLVPRPCWATPALRRRLPQSPWPCDPNNEREALLKIKNLLGMVHTWDSRTQEEAEAGEWPKI